MSSLEATQKLDAIGELKLNPEQACELFFESLQQNKSFIKPPNCDSAGDQVELLAIQNERQHNEMLELQHEMLENARRQSIINNNQTEEIFQMQQNLRKRFIESNNFFKDCDDKKRLAESKVNEEKQKHNEMKQTIQTFQNNIKELLEFREALTKTVEDFEPYERVMNEAVSESNLWNSTKDCMDRCDALMLAQVEMGKMKTENLQEIDELRIQIKKITNDAALTVLGLSNELAELERAYSQARSECLKWEKKISNIKDCIIENKFNTFRMMDEIYFMYKMLCKRRGMIPDINKSDVEKQLDFIRDEIKIIQHVINECLPKTSNPKTLKGDK